ncbi:phage regulatory CII family protein [Marinobacterium stanieri]|uniref:Phage regulatory protein CII (CP76) n=1 Tax=Marinobacterium stanieri TaxID=49186 RepID=A0A1N6Q400_9GAMM|nr:phage regulatory CII family protein [Marinobacterium stanieri]SIQ11308.1 hypothetical protein SAMN05421647_102239 [Marinobacterium stanieri]
MRKRHQDEGGILSPLMACYHAAHDYPGGLPAMAVMMHKQLGTLQKKLNPSQGTHVLTLEEAAHILRITKDPRILDALGTEGDAVWFRPDEVPAAPADLDVLSSSTCLMSRSVAVIQELEEALADGKIDAEERARLNERFMRLSQAALHVSETARQFEDNRD